MLPASTLPTSSTCLPSLMLTPLINTSTYHSSWGSCHQQFPQFDPCTQARCPPYTATAFQVQHPPMPAQPLMQPSTVSAPSTSPFVAPPWRSNHNSSTGHPPPWQATHLTPTPAPAGALSYCSTIPRTPSTSDDAIARTPSSVNPRVESEEAKAQSVHSQREPQHSQQQYEQWQQEQAQVDASMQRQPQQAAPVGPSQAQHQQQAGERSEQADLDPDERLEGQLKPIKGRVVGHIKSALRPIYSMMDKAEMKAVIFDATRALAIEVHTGKTDESKEGLVATRARKAAQQTLKIKGFGSLVERMQS